jgi:hypothetical protein
LLRCAVPEFAGAEFVAAVSEFCIVVPGCARESAFADGG